MVWKARKIPNNRSGIPPMKAESVDLRGDPGRLKAAPRARDPTARL